jgi:hypothetical protein
VEPLEQIKSRLETAIPGAGVELPGVMGRPVTPFSLILVICE